MQIRRVESGGREGQQDAEHAIRHRTAKQVDLRPQRRYPALRQRREDRPPKDGRSHHEAKMLDDMNVFVAERRIEEPWQMPRRERRDSERPSDNRVPEDALDTAERGAHG